MGDPELAHGTRRVDGHPQLAEEAGRLLLRRPAVQEAEAAGLAPEEDVGGGGQRRDEVQLLVDGADAELLRVPRPLQFDEAAVHARSRRSPFPASRSGSSSRWTCPRRSRRGARALPPLRAPVRHHRAQRHPETACGCRASGESASCRCEEWSRQGSSHPMRGKSNSFCRRCAVITGAQKIKRSKDENMPAQNLLIS